MTDRVISAGRQIGKTHRTVEQLVDAYMRAELTGPLTAVLENPALAICLENIIHANQSSNDRLVDMRMDGRKLLITARAQSGDRATPTPTKPDRMRLAAGDLDD